MNRILALLTVAALLIVGGYFGLNAFNGFTSARACDTLTTEQSRYVNIAWFVLFAYFALTLQWPQLAMVMPILFVVWIVVGLVLLLIYAAALDRKHPLTFTFHENHFVVEGRIGKWTTRRSFSLETEINWQTRHTGSGTLSWVRLIEDGTKVWLPAVHANDHGLMLIAHRLREARDRARQANHEAEVPATIQALREPEKP